MNDELFDSLQLLEKEKGIKAEVLMDAIKSSLTIACEKNFKRQGLTNVSVRMDPVKRTLGVYLDKTVVEDVEDPLTQISLGDAQMRNGKYQLGDIVPEEVNSRGFNRIAVKSAKDVIMQQVREAERMSLYADYFDKENKVITGKVQRYVGRNVIINLGKVDAMLTESEMIHGETFYPNERVKVYIVRVENGTKGPRIVLSRKSPNFVRALFEEEVAEVADGTVEIKAIAREAGSRSKMAVWSNVDNVDAVGACVGQNGSRVAAVVDELGGEKIDIVAWDENPAYFIENALSPAKVVTVLVDEDERSAKVVVPDYQLSLAIGKEGQNARLTARLTGFKIDSRSISSLRRRQSSPVSLRSSRTSTMTMRTETMPRRRMTAPTARIQTIFTTMRLLPTRRRFTTMRCTVILKQLTTVLSDRICRMRTRCRMRTVTAV